MVSKIFRRIERTASKVVPKELMKTVSRKVDAANNITKELNYYTSWAKTITGGAEKIKPVTDFVITVNNVTDLVNKPAQAVLEKFLNETVNPLTKLILDVKIKDEPIKSIIISKAGPAASNFVVKYVASSYTGIGSLPSLDIIGKANFFSWWSLLSKSSSVSSALASQANFARSADKGVSMANYYVTEVNNSLKRINSNDKEIQAERVLQFAELNNDVNFYDDDSDEVLITSGKELEKLSGNLKSEVDEDEIVIIDKRIKLLSDDSDNLFGEKETKQELRNYGVFNQELGEIKAEENELVEENLIDKEESNPTLNIHNPTWFTSSKKLIKSELAEAMTDTKYIPEEIVPTKEKIDEGWVDFLEEAERSRSSELKKLKLSKVRESLKNGLTTAVGILEEAKGFTTEVRDSYVLRQAGSTTLGKIVPYLKEIECGMEVIAESIEEAIADDEKFKTSLAQVSDRLTEGKKFIDKKINYLMQPIREEEFKTINNTFFLDANTTNLNSTLDIDEEIVVLGKEKEMHELSLLSLIKRVFNLDSNSTKELFGKEEIEKENSPQLKVSTEEKSFEETVNSIPGAWDYTPQKNLSEEEQLDNNLAEAMEEEREVFHDAIDNHAWANDENVEKSKIAIVPQQKAIIEVINPFLNKIKGISNCFYFPLVNKK